MTTCNPCNVSDSDCVPECKESEDVITLEDGLKLQQQLLNDMGKRKLSWSEVKYVVYFEKGQQEAIKLYRELKEE